MEQDETLKQQVEEAVSKFAGDFMGVSPKGVVADIHTSSVLVTLRGIIPPIEKDYAKETESRELVEKCYNNVFDVSKKAFESVLENILRRAVHSSMLRVNLDSGDGVMVFNIEERTT
jgi:uncharacterized protein YbcI